MMNKNIVIAIDGASASGKTTSAQAVARELGFIHVDTGAMYRTLAWYSLKKRVNTQDAGAVETLCGQWPAKLDCINNAIRLLVDGYHPGQEIHAVEVSAVTPFVAKAPKVREWMKTTQRQCLSFGNLVVEGRDIGAHIFPEAQFKFYLDASLTERARRRKGKGSWEDDAVPNAHDTRCVAAPLKIAADAIVINNTQLTAAQTSAQILAHVKRALATV